jgi:hypothetical protein
MKAIRWYGILYLSFLLWLLLFPPWMELSRRFIQNSIGQGFHPYTSVGHHWRFSVPYHWEWWAGPQQSYFLPNLGARIDYRLMLYEAVVGLVAVALLFLAVPPLVMTFRKITAYTRAGIIFMGTRIRNWRFQGHN